jgi:hypothetical protein
VKSPIFQIEIVEPDEEDFDELQNAIEKYPVKVFQLLNKKLNSLGMMLNIMEAPRNAA